MKSTKKNHYMKYWKVIRQFIIAKYKINTSDIDMLLFLHDEELFTQDKFVEFEKLLRWEKDRFKRLRRDGWIETVGARTNKNKNFYSTTYKTTRMVGLIYDKLNGNLFPEDPCSNPLFKKKVGTTDQIYRRMIIKMNNFIKQQQRHSPE